MLCARIFGLDHWVASIWRHDTGGLCGGVKKDKNPRYYGAMKLVCQQVKTPTGFALDIGLVFVCFVFLFVIKPENPYFASVSGLEVKLLGVYSFQELNKTDSMIDRYSFRNNSSKPPMTRHDHAFWTLLVLFPHSDPSDFPDRSLTS